jgi:hypothetical protein
MTADRPADRVVHPDARQPWLASRCASCRGIATLKEPGSMAASQVTPQHRAEGARIMDTTVSGYPAGDLRVSDAERDRALRELSLAFEVGRISASEFGERSGQVLAALTGKELTAQLADLPRDRAAEARATGPAQAHVVRVARVIAIGASAVTAASLAGVALSNALSTGPSLAQREAKRELAQQVLAHQGISISVPLPPAQGFDWAGTITPAAFAVALVVLIVCLCLARPGRSRAVCSHSGFLNDWIRSRPAAS